MVKTAASLLPPGRWGRFSFNEVLTMTERNAYAYKSTLREVYALSEGQIIHGAGETSSLASAGQPARTVEL